MARRDPGRIAPAGRAQPATARAGDGGRPGPHHRGDQRLRARGGLEIALAADLRIAGASARFGFPETTIGRFISGGASLLLPRAVGVSWAKRLVFTGEHVDADEARAIGLVEEVVEDERLLARAEELARTIAGNAPVSIALAKRVLNRVALGDPETALAFETEGLLATYATADNERGAAAFARREKPDFSGR